MRRRVVPRAKYTKPSGPFPRFDQIKRVDFRFSAAQWRKLTKLLPSRLQELTAPSGPFEMLTRHSPQRELKTISDVVIHEAEGAIASFKTAESLTNPENVATPARVRAAIRRLRKALEPFICGWVDVETANIVPDGLDDALARRGQELEDVRQAGGERGNLSFACVSMKGAVKTWASCNQVDISDLDVLRYIDEALSFGRIKHPDFLKHRDRLAALVFAKD
jgi:hypothetical protein